MAISFKGQDAPPPAVSPRVSRAVRCSPHGIPEYDIANDGFSADSAPPRPPRRPTRTPPHQRGSTTSQTRRQPRRSAVQMVTATVEKDELCLVCSGGTFSSPAARHNGRGVNPNPTLTLNSLTRPRGANTVRVHSGSPKNPQPRERGKGKNRTEAENGCSLCVRSFPPYSSSRGKGRNRTEDKNHHSLCSCFAPSALGARGGIKPRKRMTIIQPPPLLSPPLWPSGQGESNRGREWRFSVFVLPPLSSAPATRCSGAGTRVNPSPWG